MNCKNHRNISEGVPEITSHGFGIYGAGYAAIPWLFTEFPKNFYHQIVCADNPFWQTRSKYNYEKYDKYIPDWYKQTLRITEQRIRKIQEARIEKL